jgi:peptidoglycan/LPS O-acetylase OafA/YrhL
MSPRRLVVKEGVQFPTEPPRPPPATENRAVKGPRHYQFLDALRGIAVLGVVAVHTVQNFHAPIIEPGVALGTYGVALFYLVSAFSLCLSLDVRTRNERRPLVNYAIRRFFRIAPLFYLAVAIYLIKPFVLPADAAPVILDPITWPTKAWHVVATLLFLNGWHYQAINLVVPGGWSVAVETNFYLLLPFLFRYSTSRRRALAFFAGSLVAAVVCRKLLYLLVGPHVPTTQARAFGVFAALWLPSQLPVFALGIVMFRSVDRQAIGRGGDTRRLTPLFVALGLSAAFAWLAPQGARRWISDYVQASLVFLFGSMILAYRPYRLFVNRATIFLGRVSYSVYLLHFVALHLVLWAVRAFYEPSFHARPPFLVAFPCVLALAAAMSTVTFQLVEMPGQNLGRRLISSLEGGDAPLTAAGRTLPPSVSDPGL